MQFLKAVPGQTQNHGENEKTRVRLVVGEELDPGPTIVLEQQMGLTLIRIPLAEGLIPLVDLAVAQEAVEAKRKTTLILQLIFQIPSLKLSTRPMWLVSFCRLSTKTCQL